MSATTKAFTILAVVNLACLFNPQIALGDGCDQCGCHKVKKVMCLVRTYEEVETPIYQCSRQEVFCPKKCIVCKEGCRCDTFYKLHKHCECTGACDCDGNKVCTTHCTCKTDCGWKTLYAASPEGCMKQCTISQPTGEKCVKKVPVVKWVAVEVCKKCKCRSAPKPHHCAK